MAFRQIGLERVLYDRGLQPLAPGRGRNRRKWSQFVDSIWGTVPAFSAESISMPRRDFALQLCAAVHDRDHASFLGALASKPELA